MLNQTLNIDNLKKYPISVLIPKGSGAVPIERLFNNAKSGLFNMEKYKKEIWRDVVGWEGSYKVSNKGRVKSMTRMIDGGKGEGMSHVYGMLMKQQPNKQGYRVIQLCINAKKKGYLVHRLVAAAFLPNPSNFPIVNHIDHNKTNNQPENLEWCTYSHNIKHDFATGARKAKKGKEKTMAKRIRFFNEYNECVYDFDTIASAGEYFNHGRNYFHHFIQHKKKYKGLTIVTEKHPPPPKEQSWKSKLGYE